MEIPEINMISECLQNPSLISRFFSWKWGALFFAIFATFGSIIRKIKLVLIRFHTLKPQYDELFDFSDYDDDDEDDDDDGISLASSDDGEDDGEQAPASFRDLLRLDQDFGVKGGSCFFGTRRGCGGAFSDFASGKSVVKLWEGLGFSLDFDEDLFGYGSQSVVSTWDESSAGFRDFPAVVLTAEGNGTGDGVIFGGYDTRMRRRAPAIYAEWSSAERGVPGVASGGGGVGKVYVRDQVNGVLTIGDVRNVRRPLESGEETDGETWWDADAVIVD